MNRLANFETTVFNRIDRDLKEMNDRQNRLRHDMREREDEEESVWNQLKAFRERIDLLEGYNFDKEGRINELEGDGLHRVRLRNALTIF